LTVNVALPTVIVALRAGPAFADAAKFNVPDPLVPEPLTIDSHEALDVAFQAQPLPAVTAVDPVPPAAATDALEGDSA
jgi:hypothetical protein